MEEDRPSVGCIRDSISVVRHVARMADYLTSLDKHAACLLNVQGVRRLWDEMGEVEGIASALQQH